MLAQRCSVSFPISRSLLALSKQLNKLGNPARSRLGFLCRFDTPQKRIPLSLGQCLKIVPRKLIRIKRRLKIRRRRHHALSSVGAFPPAIRLCKIYLGLSRCPHTTLSNKTGDLFDVAAGPEATATTWSEALDESCAVVALALAVNPAVAEGHVDGLVVGDCGDAGCFLADFEPDALGCRCARLREP